MPVTWVLAVVDSCNTVTLRGDVVSAGGEVEVVGGSVLSIAGVLMSAKRSSAKLSNEKPGRPQSVILRSSKLTRPRIMFMTDSGLFLSTKTIEPTLR